MVTPLVGVWIEIVGAWKVRTSGLQSLPLWECGLKSFSLMEAEKTVHVTPLVGVWIEIKRAG